MARSKGHIKAQELKPVYMQDDNSPQDYALRLEAKAYMSEAHKRGKQPRFFDGELKITGEDGSSKKKITRKELQRFNLEHKITLPGNVKLPPIPGSRIYLDPLVPIARMKKTVDPRLKKSSVPAPAPAPAPAPPTLITPIVNTSQTATTSRQTPQQPPDSSGEDNDRESIDPASTNSSTPSSEAEDNETTIDEDEDSPTEISQAEEATPKANSKQIETIQNSSANKEAEPEDDNLISRERPTNSRTKGTGPQHKNPDQESGTHPDKTTNNASVNDISIGSQDVSQLSLQALDALIELQLNTNKAARNAILKRRRTDELQLEKLKANVTTPQDS